MYYALLLYPVAILILLLFQAKKAENGELREDYLSIDSAKIMQVGAALMIIVHHIAGNLTGYDSVEGTRPFALFSYIGIYCTSVFFFCSGFGLIRSYITKEDYLKGFLKKRILPLWIAFMVTNILYLFLEGIQSWRVQTPFQALTCFWGFTLLNTNAWYMIVQFALYIIFYLTFRFIRNKKGSFIVLGAGVFFLIAIGLLSGHDRTQLNGHWFKGEWWYNTTFQFLFGMLYARYYERITTFFREKYKLMLPLITVLTLLFAGVEHIALLCFGYYNEYRGFNGYGSKIITLIAQLIACSLFVMFLLLLNMKWKFGNKATGFLQGFILELYLIHDLVIFILTNDLRLSNLVLPLAVFAVSIPAAWGISKLNQLILEQWKVVRRLTILPEDSFERKNQIKKQKRILYIVYAVFAVLVVVTVISGAKYGYSQFVTPMQEAKEEQQALANASVGDTVLFGKFDTEYMTDGNERMEWTVLAIENQKALLLSKNVIYGWSYNQKYEDVIWSVSDLREELNGYMFDDVFSSYEQRSMEADPETGDDMTILSAEMVEKYLTDNESRKADLTPMAERWGTNYNRNSESSWWWLRDKGSDKNTAVYVNVDGTIHMEGNSVSIPNGGIRPAIWVKVSK